MRTLRFVAATLLLSACLFIVLCGLLLGDLPWRL